MHREAVAAEERQRVVRGRADQGDAPSPPGIERQDAVVLEHDDRLARHLAGQRDRGRRLQLDGALVGVRPLEEAEAELLDEDPPHDLVDRLHRDEAAAHRLVEVRGAVVRRQLDVEPGVERQGRRLGAVPRRGCGAGRGG